MLLVVTNDGALIMGVSGETVDPGSNPLTIDKRGTVNITWRGKYDIP